MKKTLLTLFAAMCSLSMWAKADFANFAIEVDNKSTLLVDSEKVQWQAYSIGIAVVDGTTTRVAVDADNAIATVSGKFHGEHGTANLKVVVPVPAGNYKLSVGQCTYSGSDITVTDASANVVSSKTPAQACWKNDTANVTELTFAVSEATTLTISGMSYCPYLAMQTVEAISTKYTVTYTKGEDAEVVGNIVPAAVEDDADASVVLAKNFTLYKAGYTQTGWSDGTKTYAFGDTLKLTQNYTLTPVFTQNTKSLADRTSAVTVMWDFQRRNGAPVISAQGSSNGTGVFVAQAQVEGETIDVKCDYDATSGKIANAKWTDWAQMNSGTKFTIPSVKGAAVSIESYSATTTTTFNGTAAGSDNANTVYTYNETANVDSCVIVIGDGSYFRTIQVVLPVASQDTTAQDTTAQDTTTVTPVDPSGEEYNNVAATFAWAVGNESEAAMADSISGAVSLTKMSVGTDLQVASTSATYTLGDVTAGPLVTYQPVTSNPGCVTTDMVEYTIQLKKGLTFTPTSVSFDAVKEGTDGAYFSWSYTVDGVESDIVAYSDPKTQIRRNNNANPSSPLTHNETISGANGGKKVTLRFYISNVANNKKMSIGNIKLNGNINGSIEKRKFVDFKIDFRSDPYTVVAPSTGLPAGVAVTGTYHDPQHGYTGGTIVVPVDGPVKFTIATCNYSGAMTVKNAADSIIASLNNNGSCDSNTSTDYSFTWTYNSETADTLTFKMPSYYPFFYAEACDLIPMRTVTYYDVDGKTIIGKEDVEGGSALKYIYNEENVTVAEGCKFRGWFNSTQASAVKVAEGTSVQENLSLYAKATAIEVATVGSIFNYPLNSTAFYIEDHELIESTGKFHDSTHGYGFGSNQNVSVKTAGNAVLVLTCCQYGNTSAIVVTDANGVQVGDSIQLPMSGDGATASVTYVGEPTTLTATFTNGGYLHNVTVYNVENVPTKDEYGYYELAAGDGASLQLVLAALQAGDKIYLPNGTYDFGEKVLTTISAKNVSIIGESMEGTIIKNAPDKSTEGIGTTATLLNTSDGLYLQDLTIQNAMTFDGGTGRAVCLQDKGKNTICKNVCLLSYQDTYYSNAAYNFYWEDCEIHGVVDYICGDGDVVYNRTKFVNEKIKNTTIAAPYTSASCKWGYVMLDCEIETLCDNFNFGRSWGGESKLQYIRCKDLSNKLVSSRWTTAGMNIAAYKFMEYGTMDKDGNVTTPSSNVVNFTHSSGNKSYETVLTAEEAAQYTVANIYGEWKPDSICAQVTDQAQGTIFLVDGKITNVVPAEGTSMRIANGRGGFGPVVTATTGIQDIEAQPQTSSAVVYDLMGRKVNELKAGQVYMKAGKCFLQK